MIRFPSIFPAIFPRVVIAASLVTAISTAGPGIADAPTLPPVLQRWDADPHPDLRAVVVLRNGHVIAERYFNGERPDTLHDIRSAGKSVTALLAGIAIDRGMILGEDDTLARHWPRAADSAVGKVKLTDLLTMRSGLAARDDDPASPGHEDKLDAAPDPLDFLLGTPAAASPGTIYRYNSLTAYAVGIFVEKAAGMPMASFARRNLFAPLGITRWKWAADRGGHTKGQGNLSLTARDFARIGEMVRQGGSFGGRRIVASQWIARSVSPIVDIADVDRYADGYGYFWYVKTHDIAGCKVAVRFASGNGGNKIYIVPGRGLVVAITSSAYGHGYGQKRSEDILKAVLTAEVPSCPARE